MHLIVGFAIALVVALIVLLGMSVIGLRDTKVAKASVARAAAKDPVIWSKTKRAFAQLHQKRPDDVTTGSFTTLSPHDHLADDKT